MAYSNAFDLLADYDNDDPSALIADHRKTAKKSAARSPGPAKKPLATTQPIVNAPSKPVPQSKPVKEAKVSRGFDYLENNCVLERGFHRKFGVAEDGEFEKPSGDVGRGGGGGGGRSRSSGGTRRSYQSGSRLYCRPGRAYIDAEAEDYLVTMSSKYRIFDRHSACGRGNVVKREGFRRGNWGSVDDEGLEQRPVGLTNCSGTYPMIEEGALRIFNDDLDDVQTEEVESEDQEMTLDEYEKLMEEKKKALQAILLEFSAKQNNDGDFIKQGLENGSALRTDDKEELADGFVIVDAAEEEFQIL